MNGNTVLNYRDPSIIRKLGIEVLIKELGVVGMAYFIRQFDMGEGDYTAEREKLLDGITFDEIIKSVRELEK